MIAPLLALVLAGAVQAGSPDSLDPQAMAARHQQLRAEILENDSKYKGLDSERRQQVLERSSALLQMLEGRTSAAEFSEREQKTLAAEAAWIELALGAGAGAAEERLICRSEKVIGTNRRTRVCRTAAEIELERTDAQRFMTRPSTCTAGSPGCTGG